MIDGSTIVIVGMALMMVLMMGGMGVAAIRALIRRRNRDRDQR